MPRIVVNNKSFNVEVDGSDTGQIPPGGTSIRLPVCSLVYPPAGEFMLNEPTGNSDLGSLSFSVEATGESFSSKNQPITINNKLVVKQVQVDVDDSEFRPCYLDFDKDGVISARDVEKVYRDIPFVDPRFDVNGDGIVDSEDFTLAKEYVGTVCQIGPPPPPKVMPVLDLDGSNYDGLETWLDASGNNYHFSVRKTFSNGTGEDRHFPPIKNEDGSVTVGLVKILDSDPNDALRIFERLNVVEYESNKSFTAENIENETATTEGVYREKYIPDVDQDYSLEFVFKFTDNLPHGGFSDTKGRFKVFGYANYGFGGYNFGSGYYGYQYAYDPESFIPYHGFKIATYAGRGVDSEPGSYNNSFPHPSDYPNPLPYSLKVLQIGTGVNNRYRGGSAELEDFSLGLNSQSGLSDGSVFYVQYVVSPSSQTVKLYVNGVEQPAEIKTPVGIGLPEQNAAFVIGTSPQGGWSPPDGLDIFMLRVYDEALSEEEVINNYNRYLEKYGS